MAANNDKLHYCFKCHTRTEEYDEINGVKIWVCDSRKCMEDLEYIRQHAEVEEREFINNLK